MRTRDLSSRPTGLPWVVAPQIKAELLPASLICDVLHDVAGGYLDRARATVARQ
jgi:hypothetical protein